jgi:16S rRNA processing protein RimM
MNDRLILMGAIGRPHGVRGAVHVTAYTENPRGLADYSLTDGKGRRFRLSWLADGVAQVAELTASGEHPVKDRNAAERLTNLRLFAPREALPEPDEDEFYLADLIGLAARDVSGIPIGTVALVHDYGAGVSLEINAESGPVVVPFTRDAVPEVDIAAGYLVVVPPAEIIAEPPV